MSSKFYSKQDLDGMNLGQLEAAMDKIVDREDELLLDEIIRRKKGIAPLLGQVYRGDLPDIKTPEEEAYWQKIIDERVEALRNRGVSTPVETSKYEEFVPLDVVSTATTGEPPIPDIIGGITETTKKEVKVVKKRGRPAKKK